MLQKKQLNKPIPYNDPEARLDDFVLKCCK